MKKTLLLLLFLSASFLTAQAQESTTYYLIRHAEKSKDNPSDSNPKLNKTGENRAENWAAFFKEIPLDRVFSTNYHRTLQTAKPIAESKSIEIQSYNPRKLYSTVFQKKTQGKSVLIVGHSNTTPAFVNAILQKQRYGTIPENTNDHLYIVTVNGENIQGVLLKIPASLPVKL